MLSIGAFAHLGGVSVRTLRYYEQLGVLVPAAVDDVTGYRSYDSAQLLRLNRIAALKDLGLSLQQVRPLLDDLDVGQLRDLLVVKRTELRQQVAEIEAARQRVEARLRHIDKENDMLTDITTKRVPELRLADIRIDVPGLDFDTMRPHIRAAYAELTEYIRSAGIKARGPLLVLHYEPEGQEAVIPHVGLAVGDQAVPASGRIRCVALPATEVISTVHTGRIDHSEVGPLYSQLAQWAAEHGYPILGPGRDLIIAFGDSADGSGVIELQLPIG